MAKQIINVGTTANDKKGDSLRAAFQKVNANFSELYTVLGLDADNTLNLGAFEFNGSTITTTDSSSITIDRRVTVSSDLLVGGDITPNVANGGNLGSAANPWNSLYVSNNTIYIAGNALGIDNQGELIWNNNRVAHTGGEFITLDSLTDVNASSPSIGDTISWNGSAWVNSQPSGVTANTGDVTFNGVKIIGAGTASGDGNNFSTLELVPDNNLYTNNQYLVIDPTYPTHIHIRAGGTQDNSTAELFLGGERNHVRVYDGVGVKLQNDLFTSNFYNFQQGVDYDTATWNTDEFGNTWLDIYITDPMNPTRSSDPFSVPFYSFTQFPQNRIEVFDGTNYTDLIGNGQAFTLGNQYQLRIGITQAPGTNPTSISSMTFRVDTLTQNSLLLENNGFDLSVNNNAYVYANQTIQLTTGTGNLRITTDDNNSSYTWYFTAQGYLQFPQGLAPTTSKGKAGDEAGSVVFDGTHIYYCTTDYTDGLTDIWKRVQWSADTW